MTNFPLSSSLKGTIRGTPITPYSPVSKAGKIAVLILYVDDNVLFGDDTDEIVQLKKKMGFEIKDLENLKYFLEMEIS